MVQPPARVFDDVPVLCGHRGSGRGIVGGQRENTLGSCRAAVAAGIRWVEVDVRVDARGTLVASHEPLTGADEELTRSEDLLGGRPPELAQNRDIRTAPDDANGPHDEATAA